MADGGLFATATKIMIPFVGNLAMAGRHTLYSNYINETKNKIIGAHRGRDRKVVEYKNYL